MWGYPHDWFGGAAAPGDKPPVLGPPVPLNMTRYCTACDCSTYGLPMDPCWYCGGRTQEKRPAYWQDWKSPSDVRAGDQWSPGDPEEEREEAAWFCSSF